MHSGIPNFTQPSKPPPGVRVFNDDLLTNPGDLEYAKTQFPESFHLLDHPELRRTFAVYERAAIEAQNWVRRLGFLAVALGTIALLSSATEPLWHDQKHAQKLTIIFEFFGLGAAVIAGGSLWLGPWRKRWLESRFMTERLRQWHFQLLIRKGAEIETLLNEGSQQALERFHAERKKWFDEFLHEFEGKLDSRMDSLANDSDFSADWLHRAHTYFNSTSPAFVRVCEMYCRLRFNHQYDYAMYKLSASADRPFWQFFKWPALRQEAAIRGGGSFCFIAALLCSVAVILNRYNEFSPSLAPYLDSGALSLAIIGIALRTMQDGLGITEDIERYRDYRSKVRRLILDFEGTTDQHKRIRLMEEMELLVVDELRGFLRTHQKSAFSL